MAFSESREQAGSASHDAVFAAEKLGAAVPAALDGLETPHRFTPRDPPREDGDHKKPKDETDRPAAVFFLQPMSSLPPVVQTFLCRALFSASVVYLAVAVLILRPTNWFGLAHGVWGVICVAGSWRAFQAAKRRDSALK